MFPIRDDQPRYSTPYVNGFLIALNILVYLFQSSLDLQSYELFARQFGVVPSHLAVFLAGSPKYPLGAIVIPFFTSMFLHAGWMHVLGNMWFLYIFGDNIEDYLGHFLYLVFYLLCGLFAVATQIVIYPHSNLPMVGASGAIADVLGNMWFLYIFGDNIEDYLGHFLYLVFYLLCGLFAVATQIVIYPHSNLPMVGASGAIAGVLGAY